MKLTPEQLAEWKALVPKLNDDSNDHMGVAHSADMAPQHTVNFRHAKNAHEAARAIPALIADLEEAQRRISISEAFAKELSSELITTRKQLAEAQARNAQVLSVAEKMRCAGGPQEFQYWFDELKSFLLRKQDASSLDAAIAEAIEPYRKDAACWQFARKELSWSRAWFEQIKWAMYIEMDAPNITAERVTDDSVARALDAAVLAAIAAKGDSECPS